jgi:outer membrane lipoprotein-sorting protein
MNKIISDLKAVTLSITGVLVLLTAFPLALPSHADDDVLARSRAMYAALNSYADTGIIIKEGGSATQPVRDRHTFTTSFSRAPRGFFFEFKKEGGDRFVVWGDPQAFHTWWKTTSVKSDYPNPSNTGAFVGTEVQTIGSSAKIPPLLYSKASLPSVFANFTDAVLEGDDDVGGHKCHRLAGTARDVYGATGREVNVRKMTVWIDDESLLIRQIVEEWKPLPGQISRVTTTFEPQANPTLDDGRFKFTPP